MAYREVTMLEIKEVLRQWLGGWGKKRVASRSGLDPKTVRRYIQAAADCGLRPESGLPALTEDKMAEVMHALRGGPGRPRGPSWQLCEAHRERIARLLQGRVRLSKVRRLLLREGIRIPYPTLHRFAVAELDFGRRAATIAVVDGEPGGELQVDTGWMTLLEPEGAAGARRFRAWIFTAVRSRHRFVYPCFKENTATAIEACEAAWEFFDGVFRVLIPDNTKAIISQADPLSPVATPDFLEYAQARGFALDPARVRRARDKGRVERAVIDVREDCFRGEVLRTLDDACRRARTWCLDEYGTRRHSTTQRRPLEHFLDEEQPALLPAPVTPYEAPLFAGPKVARDQYAQVAKALYSLPRQFMGQKLRARADSQTVRFYAKGILVKTHPRKPPGGRATDPADFPPEKAAYAHRDVAFFRGRAAQHGPAIGALAGKLLEGPLPWARMRQVYALLSLAKKYGDDRVEAACRLALAAEMHDVHRLKRMLAHGAVAPPSPGMPLARYLRSPRQYALPLHPTRNMETTDDH